MNLNNLEYESLSYKLELV